MTSEPKQLGPRLLVPLAPGFEEVEAVTVIDVLRRAEIEVVVAGLEPGLVTGSHGIAVQPDAALGDLELDSFEALVLPGGLPGTDHLEADHRIVKLVQRLAGEGAPTAAICAAPRVLHTAGVVQGLQVTSHPSVRGMLDGSIAVHAPAVVKSGAVTTSQGVGTALAFALSLVADFRGFECARQLGEAMVVDPRDWPNPAADGA